ncbi:MAG: DHH family phosphoesterase [Bacilli bacterium]|nr:DHH family phosphoesterase [Bacilli bacterium]
MALNDIKELREILEERIKNSSNVFIVGHNNIDLDVAGSSIGLARLVKEYDKDVYIIVDDLRCNIQSGIISVMDSVKYDYKFIVKADVDKLVNNRSLLLVTDVNKKKMFSVGNMLDRFKDIVVIDHHTEDKNSVITPYKFIDKDLSSASEIVARVLNCSKIKYDANVANALYAGMSLDTQRFQYNTSPMTHDTAEKLIKHGADKELVRELLLEEFDDRCKVWNLILSGTFIYKYSRDLGVSFTLNRNMPKQIYQMADCAKAANEMFDVRGVDASFTIGYVSSDMMHISARGNGRVDVSKVMMKLGGGGNPTCAGCEIKDKDIFEVEKELMDSVEYGIDSCVKLYKKPKLLRKIQ